MFASPCVAYTLWALLGLFGAHRFYVGRPVSGLVWMFTGGLCGIGWIIDFFMLPSFVEEVRVVAARAFSRHLSHRTSDGSVRTQF